MSKEFDRSQPTPLKMRYFKRPEDPRISDNRREAIEAGNFLKSSGLSDVVINFYQSKLKSMPFQEMGIDLIVDPTVLGEDLTQAVNANMFLEWVDPEFLQRLRLTVAVGRSQAGEKYISASLVEVPHFKRLRVDPRPQVTLMYLGKNFRFGNPTSRNAKAHYKKWLTEKILNFENIETLLGPSDI